MYGYRFLGLGGSSSRSGLLGNGSGASENVQAGTGMHPLDQTLGLELQQYLSSSTSVNFHAIHQDSNGNELVSGNFLQKFVHRGLVNDHSII